MDYWQAGDEDSPLFTESAFQRHGVPSAMRFGPVYMKPTLRFRLVLAWHRLKRRAKGMDW